MKLTLSRTELFNRMAIVGKIINPKTPVPVAENYLFKVDGNRLTIVTTDLETTLSTTMPLEAKSEKFVLAIPPKLMEVLKEMPEQLLHLDIDEESAKIEIKNDSGSYKGDFMGVNVGEEGEDFPKPRGLEGDVKTFELTSELLYNGINKTIFAAAEEDSRPVMTGVLFDIFENNITFVATDAHKLVKYNVENVANGFEGSFILPRKPANVLKNIVVKSDEKVKISFDDKNIVFELPEFTMICRRIEGRYPNYNAVIQQNQLKIIVDRGSMLSAIKRVKVFANTGTGLIILKIGDNNLNISTQDLDFSTSADENVVCQYSDEEITIGFKAELLEQLLSNMTDSQVMLELADPSKAGIIVPFENTENEELIMLLMPMFI